MSKQMKTMTEGAPWKHIVKFAFPVFLGSLLQQLYNTVDAIIVGNFSGEDALSAVGTTGTITFLFLAIAVGFSSGNGVVIAQHFGAGNEKEVRKNSYWCCTCNSHSTDWFVCCCLLLYDKEISYFQI